MAHVSVVRGRLEKSLHTFDSTALCVDFLDVLAVVNRLQYAQSEDATEFPEFGEGEKSEQTCTEV